MGEINCKYAELRNSDGMIWCNKKNIYVTGNEEKNCEFFEAK
ncbi:MAG: hypothetical protein ACTSVE_07365 [Candidatus Helarchaeota archaeon]